MRTKPSLIEAEELLATDYDGIHLRRTLADLAGIEERVDRMLREGVPRASYEKLEGFRRAVQASTRVYQQVWGFMHESAR